MSETPDPPRSPEEDAYTPIAEEAMPEPLVEGEDDVILQPGAEAFASPGEPSPDGGEDPTAENAEPVPEE